MKRLFLALALTLTAFGQGTPTVQFKTIADLIAYPIPSISTRLSALVTGRLTENDGYGGTFYYDAASSATDDGGITFKPTSFGGRWSRQYVGPIQAGWFGVVGDGATDSNAALLKAITSAAGSKLVLPLGTVLTSVPLILTNQSFVLAGRGINSTILKYSGAGSISNVVTFISPIYPNYGYDQSCEDIGIDGNGKATNGVNIIRISNGIYRNVGIGRTINAHLLVDGAVHCLFDNVRVSNTIGITGTAPNYNLIITGVGLFTANDLVFNLLRAEGASVAGVLLTNNSAQVVMQGTIEAGAKGLRLAAGSEANTFILDCESNSGNDLDMDAGADGNKFINCLFNRAAMVSGYLNSLDACRIGSLTVTTNAFETQLRGSFWNVNHTDGLTNNGVRTEGTLVDAFTGSVTNFVPVAGPITLTSPVTILNSDGDTNYTQTIAARVVRAGAVSWDLKTINGGFPATTNLTLGFFGNVGVGFPAVDDAGNASKLSVNGGFSVGTAANPGANNIFAVGNVSGASITDTGLTASKLVVTDGSKNLASSSISDSSIVTSIVNGGTGNGVLSSLSGHTATLNSLAAGSNVTIVSNANVLTINASGGGGSGLTNVTSGGTGKSLVGSISSTTATLNSVTNGTFLDLSSNANTLSYDVRVAADGVADPTKVVRSDDSRLGVGYERFFGGQATTHDGTTKVNAFNFTIAGGSSCVFEVSAVAEYDSGLTHKGYAFKQRGLLRNNGPASANAIYCETNTFVIDTDALSPGGVIVTNVAGTQGGIKADVIGAAIGDVSWNVTIRYTPL